MIKPEKQFFLFGMGHRQKTVYKDGKLINVSDNSVIYSWDVADEEFIYRNYSTEEETYSRVFYPPDFLFPDEEDKKGKKMS